jgi:UDP-3-O-[3-hydroxymyristoyl] glucosamine N-acyltransferase
MPDPRFFESRGPFSLAELARRAGAAPAEGAPLDRQFRDIAPLDAAGPEHVSFLENVRYAAQFAASRAGACLIHPSMADRAPAGMALLLAERPRRAFAYVARAFHPENDEPPGIDAGARIDPAAVLGADCRVDAGAVIGPGAELGARCRIAHNAVIGRGVKLGADCVVGANAVISHALIGERVVIYPGACIGQAGFGFDPSPQGHLKIPQLGRVIIEDDVEVGANSTIDRGSGSDTVVGRGTMIDNLVQIGHNVRIGRGCVLVAQVGIAGSTRLGDFVTLAGQAGLSGHLTIGDGATIGPQSGIKDDVPAGKVIMGSPGMEMKEFGRLLAAWRRLAAPRKGAS